MLNSDRLSNLRHMRILLCVAQVNSISRASELINMSQPAVTQAIAKMEADYGVQLFDRRATGSFPTREGAILIRRIARFFEIADAAVGAARHSARSSETAPPLQIEQLLTSTQIRAFLAIMDSAHTAEHAREMGVSVTSLLRSSRALEKTLGRTVFRRTATGVEGNQVGTALACKLRVAVREIEYGYQELAEACRAAAPVIRVGVLPMSGSFILSSAINALMQEEPEARVIVLDGNYAKLLEDLRLGKIDMMFGLLRKPADAVDVVEEPIFMDTFYVMGRRNHPLTRYPMVTTRQLAEYNWIAPAPGTPRRGQIDKLFAKLDPAPRLGIETSSLSTIRALVLSSDLLTIMSQQEAYFEELTGLFSPISFDLKCSLPPKGITVRANWLPTVAHQRFISLLRWHSARNQGGQNHHNLLAAPNALERIAMHS